MEHTPRKLVNAHTVARLLRVPATWILAETKSGRLPHLRAGKRLLFDVEAVERELLRRASKPVLEREHEGAQP